MVAIKRGQNDRTNLRMFMLENQRNRIRIHPFQGIHTLGVLPFQDTVHHTVALGFAQGLIQGFFNVTKRVGSNGIPGEYNFGEFADHAFKILIGNCCQLGHRLTHVLNLTWLHMPQHLGRRFFA